MIKRLTLVLALLALVAAPFAEPFQKSGTADAASPHFSDIQPSQEAAVNRLVDEDVLAGYEDGTFRPDKNVSRAEAVTMIGRITGFSGYTSPDFSDVSDSDYFVQMVAGAVHDEITRGYEDNTFRPHRDVTRGEMATFLTRAFTFTNRDGEANFWDIYPGKLHATGTEVITTAGIANGYPDGSFRPDQSITRYEMVLFLDRVLHPEERVSNDGSPEVEGMTGETRVVTASSGLNVRPGPNTDGSPIDRIASGTEVDVLETVNGGWALILHNGEFAYVSNSYLRSPGGSLAGKTIVVDPGHGGHDPGASAYGVVEKNVVLNTGNYLAPMLEAQGAHVIQTRSTDRFISLSGRTNMANNAGADAFISIHANAAGSSAAHGTETYWSSNYSAAESRELAEKINSELVRELNTRDRGAKQANFHVTRESRMPSVLVELGFVTNYSEAQQLNSASTQRRAAEAITRGTVDFFN
ncbi:N-acetylmuramoyl-L-alanine amidase [Salsuginibacillus halophilus]|uniref:N-acetylmuramoyl-L-alanine amidase n=1 Tax=Salsuginibacillus halophilus TaxID=517424 RepID=A0A2P8HHP1_9BACI|nr:N-acetylmuramoyl-L-alanine amidase [Salsuginibacillus halophilus]PSL45748.1 N-acetylmuramoyl-L-alanine amidase [Salsuginibacillus halophilus]